MKMYTVRLTYFGEDGSFCGDVEYPVQEKSRYLLMNEVRDLLERGERPGLVEESRDFYVLVELPDHPETLNHHSWPELYVPENLKKGE
jgi:hypothetical protein